MPQVQKLESEREQWKKHVEPVKKKLREVEESESVMRIALEKSERDNKVLKDQNASLHAMFAKADTEAKKSEGAFKALDAKFKVFIVQFIIPVYFIPIHFP